MPEDEDRLARGWANTITSLDDAERLIEALRAIPDGVAADLSIVDEVSALTFAMATGWSPEVVPAVRNALTEVKSRMDAVIAAAATREDSPR